ncbi:MAG: NUDIX hydrolase [Anaerolineae bacterium]
MTDPQWLVWANRIRAIAAAGRTYTRDPFDRERYEQLQQIAAEILTAHTDTDVDTLYELIDGDFGYPTPKVDVRGVVLREGRILLVREKLDDGRWTLPGGWADIYDSPSESVEREIEEESGFEARAVRLLAVYDRQKWPHPPHPNYTYILFFLCEITGGQPTTSLETGGVGWFPPDALPELSTGRVLPEQIARLVELARHPEWPTDFD